ncbi:MAG: Amuc_1102 family pilus-like protein [Verrucomicrobiota bacterium]
MKNSQKLALVGVVGVVAMFARSEAMAQDQVKVEVEDISIEIVETPEYSTSESKKLPKKQEWVEIEVIFQPEGRTESGIVENLEFSYYVMLGDEKTMLYEKINHVNMLLDEATASVVYIAPSTILGLFGREASASKAVAAVAVEIRHNGALVGGDATLEPSSRWWQTKTQTPGKLKKKSDTPFAPLWWDRYADVEQSR